MAANFGCIRNAAGYNDWHQILIICVHSAWEMPILLMADHRVKSRLDLISWRWLLPSATYFCPGDNALNEEPFAIFGPIDKVPDHESLELGFACLF